mmetsp:Transcript_16155/g.37825  ORF Transcript_16155/g.37825 Transcript_16155/m.37825 type:complete len:121 (-) Transcript_16155:109-471(-)|eukprot:CAMPEP_0171057456 /NCGR_PEP_ID=MMETSP0766_2-20121228/1819_1 /TAXON_ID=439317 /ORGANISM="Gambierdiscus australes, Strain CAWD 149" /LENGTH=120 /DNA_ID=CAMNT_0011512581 /DNA_START=48 /DNA_END=410 /DNA_ORIENTATION=-
MSSCHALFQAARSGVAPRVAALAKGASHPEWASAGADAANVFGLYSYSLRTGFMKLEWATTSSAEFYGFGSRPLSGTSKFSSEARRHTASVSIPTRAEVEDVFGHFTYSLRTGFLRKIYA